MDVEYSSLEDLGVFVHGVTKGEAEAKYGTGISPSANADLEPIFYEYGVDIYWAGHIHFYETFTGPLSLLSPHEIVCAAASHTPGGCMYGYIYMRARVRHVCTSVRVTQSTLFSIRE